MAVPLFDTVTPLAPIDAEIRAKVNAIIDSKRFIFGPEVEAFEREFAAYVGTSHAVGVANGTDEQAGLGELVSLPAPTPGAEPAWHLFVVKSDRADELIGVLKDADIGTAAYYRVPAHLQPALRAHAPRVALPGTEEAARTNLAIPMSPVLSRAQVDEVVAAAGALTPA